MAHEAARNRGRKRRLNAISGESARNKRQKRILLDEVARQAGLTYSELAGAKIVRRSDESIHVYYGGKARADGNGHGHIVMRHDKLTYHRAPGVPNRRPEYFATDEDYVAYEQLKGRDRGWLRMRHGTMNGRPITFAYGWGSNAGTARVVRGHVDERTFYDPSTSSTPMIGDIDAFIIPDE